jgi:hypothetical protein
LPAANKTTFLLIDREGTPVVITPKEHVAERWSEEGRGDYRELEVVYQFAAIKGQGGVDDAARS